MKNCDTACRKTPPRAKLRKSAGHNIEMEESHQEMREKLFRPEERPFLLSCCNYYHTLSHPGDWRRRIKAKYLAATLIVEGETAVRIDDVSFIAEKDELVFLPPDSDYETCSLTESEREALIIRGSALESLLRGMELQRTFSAPPGSELRELFERLHALLKEPPEHQPGLFSQLSFSLIDLARAQTKNETLPRKLRELLQWSERHLDRPQDAAELADRLHVSTSTLNRMFRKYLNTSPRQYLIARRMDAALRMMEDPDFRVKEIAEALGFTEPANFATEFRRVHGFSPSEMRKGR